MTAADVENVLRAAHAPLTVLEICQRAWGRAKGAEQNQVRVTLWRLAQRGLIEKTPRKFRLVEVEHGTR